MFEMIKLPYATNALEPYIDATTVETHYGKHLQTYFNNLEKIAEVSGEVLGGKSLEELLSTPENLPEDIRPGVVNQGGGVYNHNLYFSILSPTPKKSPEGKLLEAINKAFGSVEEMKAKVSNEAITWFGSGYGVLAKDKEGNLYVRGVKNQDTTLCHGLKPILLIDVWEHAYYLKYKNLRKDYVDNIWNVIDFAKVEELYNEC